MMLLAVFGVVLVFIAIVASTIYIFNTQKKVIEQKQQNLPPAKPTQSAGTQSYTAADQSWSLDYPADWYIDSDQATDSLILSDTELTPADSEPAALFVSRINGEISQLIDEKLSQLDDAKINTVHNGSTVGTEVAGFITEGAPSKFSPGTYSVNAYFVLPDGDIINIYTYNEDFVPVYQKLVDSFRILTVGEETTEDVVNIVVDQPLSGDTVSSPLHLSGQARVFENTVNYKLVDDEGGLITEGYVTANAPDIGQFGSFSQDILFVTTARTGTLQVFQYSAKDGSMDDLVEIPLNFN